MTTNLPERDGGWLEPLMRSVMPSPAGVREYVGSIRSKCPGLDQRQLAEELADRICWQYATQGALLALPGAIPGLGTLAMVGVEAGAISTDLALMLRNQSYMALAVAEVFEHDLESEDRLWDLLFTVGLWCGAIKPVGEATARLATKVAMAQFKRVPAEIFKKINRTVGTTIITKYGTRRGGIAIGKLIPFGVGALVGGGFNLATMKGFKGACLRYYGEFRDGDTVLVVED